MRLSELLNLGSREMVCAVGGGGKTTVLFELGKELFDKGKKVIISTTTKIYVPDSNDVSTMIMGDLDIRNNREHIADETKLTVLGTGIITSPADFDKLLGVSSETLDALFCTGEADYVLVEADGAKGKPIKAPAEHEPCMPKGATLVLGVVGTDAVGETLREEVFHRADLFIGQKYYPPDSFIDTNMIKTLVSWDRGLFKNSSENARKILILNKADDERRRNIAREIANKVLSGASGVIPEKVIVTSFLGEGFAQVII